jgi:hypothetical protein
MTARKKADTQYKIRADGPDRGETMAAAFFVWAPDEKQARKAVARYAPKFTVVEVKKIGTLIPGEALDPPSRRTDASTEPADCRVKVWLPKSL